MTRRTTSKTSLPRLRREEFSSRKDTYMRNRTSRAKLRSEETASSKHVFRQVRPSFLPRFLQTLVLGLLLTGPTSRGMAQASTGETVIQRATEQFERSPLKTISLGDGLFLFSGDGG